jgi:hypothetical protein
MDILKLQAVSYKIEGVDLLKIAAINETYLDILF